MSQPLKAQVKGGRLLLDEPSELPEGTIVELCPASVEPQSSLSWKEIQALYPNAWVVLVELLFTQEAENTKRVCGGLVFAHSEQRGPLLRATKDALSGQEAAYLFTGKASWNKFR